MEIIVFRHAIAEDREDFAKTGLEDHLRPLTLKGRKKMQKVLVHLRDQLKGLDLIVTSPYVRAVQTAEIISQIYFEVPISEVPELIPQASPEAILKWIRTKAKSQKRIALVGHEPHLSAFISYFLSGKAESFVDLKKSGVVGLEIESYLQAQPGCAQLKFYIPPKFLI